MCGLPGGVDYAMLAAVKEGPDGLLEREGVNSASSTVHRRG